MSLLRLLISALKLGLIALATGCLVFAIVLALLFYDSVPIALSLQIATASGIFASVVGFVIDNKVGITRSIYREIAQKDFDKALGIYEFQKIVSTALLKYFEGVYYDGLASEFLQNIFKNPYRKEFNDRVFIIENVPPQIQKDSRLNTDHDLQNWILLVEEARGCLIEVREAMYSRNFIKRWFAPYRLTLVQATVELWKSRNPKKSKNLLLPPNLPTIPADMLLKLTKSQNR